MLWVMIVVIGFEQPVQVHTYYNTLTGCYIAAQHALREGVLKAECAPGDYAVRLGVPELEGARDNSFPYSWEE